MRISKIITIDTPKLKCKLIVARPIVSGNLYLSGYPVFFDYKDGVLKQYASNTHTSTPFPSFKDALKHIQSL